MFGCSEQSPENHLLSAKQHLEKQEVKSAIIELKNAIKQNPNLAEARFLLGKAYIGAKQYLNAEKELSRALDLKYPINKVVPLLSLAYQKTKSDVALIELSHKEKDYTAEQAVEIAFYKLQALMRLDQKEKSQGLIKEIQGYDTESPFKQLTLVYALLLRNNVEAAQAQLASIIEQHPEQPDTLKLQAFLYAKTEQLNKSADTYLKYLTLYPEDAEITFATARVLTDVNRSAEAEPLIDMLLKVSDRNSLLNQLKGIARYTAKDHEQALLYTEKAIEARTEDPALRLIAGYSAYFLNDYESAHKHLSIIAGKLPPSHDGLRVLATSQLQLGLNLEAGTTIEQLDDISSKDNSLISSVGLALMKSGEVAKARDLLDKVSAEDATTAEDLARLGLLQLSLNDVTGIANLELSLDKKPNEAMTKTTLATAYLTTGKIKKALALADSWKKADAKDPAAFMLAGLAYANDKEFEKAKAQFTELLVINPKHQQAQLALVQLLFQQGEFTQAKKVIDDLLAEQADFVPALIKLYLFDKQNGTLQNAIKVIEQQYLADKKARQLSLLWSKVLLSQQKMDEAIAVLENIAVDKDLPETFLKTLGNAYISSRANKKAELHYQKWLTLYPNSKDGTIGYLMILDNQREYQKALTLTQSYLSKKQGDVQISLLRVHFLLSTSDYAAAEALLLKLPEQAQSLAFAKGLLGQIQFKKKQYGKAVTNLKTAYQDIQSSRNVRLLYMSLFGDNKAQQGYEFVAAHVQQKPTDLASIMFLANLQLKTNTDDAIVSYEKALTLSSKNFVALNNLAYFYLEKNQLDNALDKGLKALEVRPDMPDVLDTVGRIYIARKDYDNALKYHSKAVSGGEVSEEIYLNYVESLLLADKKVLAKRKLNQRSYKLKESLTKVALLKKSYQL